MKTLPQYKNPRIWLEILTRQILGDFSKLDVSLLVYGEHFYCQSWSIGGDMLEFSFETNRIWKALRADFVRRGLCMPEFPAAKRISAKCSKSGAKACISYPWEGTHTKHKPVPTSRRALGPTGIRLHVRAMSWGSASAWMSRAEKSLFR